MSTNLRIFVSALAIVIAVAFQNCSPAKFVDSKPGTDNSPIDDLPGDTTGGSDTGTPPPATTGGGDDNGGSDNGTDDGSNNGSDNGNQNDNGSDNGNNNGNANGNTNGTSNGNSDGDWEPPEAGACKPNKIMFCHNIAHNPHEICVNRHARGAHDGHGDYEGFCRP